MEMFTPWSKKQWLIAALATTGVLVVLVVIALTVGSGAGKPPDPSQPPQTSDPVQTQTEETTEPPQTMVSPTQTQPSATTQPPITTQPPATTQPPETTVMPTHPVQQDPQVPNEGGVSNTVPKQDNETYEITFGIDVSKYQGVIDWAQVAQAGVDFAMIRVGYRTLVDGAIVADSSAKYNLQQAQKYGIQIGAYFFSTAITDEEAREEAAWVVETIAPYSITYPVAYNCEGFTDPENRQHSLTKRQRTDIALAFLKAVAEKGYTPMFYASRSELQGNAQWDTSRIDSQFKIWVAQYPALAYPQTEKSDYTGSHAMWQHTANGSVPGISGKVDMNIAYFGCSDISKPVDPSQPEEKPDWDAQMNFKPVNETVTAKQETNLRNIPSQGDNSTVVHTLKNGETATRIAISDYGWSKLEYKGQICYAVSSLLTTDLTPPPPAVQTPFTPVSEQVTAKIEVNLRTLPSTEREDSEVVYILKNGEYILRTGINTDVGWSRVEYNGQILYCISSYLITAEGSQPTE